MARKNQKKHITGVANGLTPEGVFSIANQLSEMSENYRFLFQVGQLNQSDNAGKYLKGLLRDGLRNKSIERISEKDQQSNYQSMHHFITDSKWKHRPVFEKVAHDASQEMGTKSTKYLILDESAHAKKGNMSVGVARQWNGRLGKVDNCQIGIHGLLATENDYCLIDTELYLPKDWVNNEARMDKAKIPSTHRTYKGVTDIAIEIVKRQINKKIKFEWVLGDGNYGKNIDFSGEIEELGKLFMIDFHKDTRVFMEKPNFSLPEYSGRGRQPINEQADIADIRLDEIWDFTKKIKSKKINLRQGTKNKIEYEFKSQNIWLFNSLKNKYSKYTLIIRRNYKTKDDYKYSITNAPEKLNIETLAKVQGMRFWIERSFQDAKSGFGMGDYQTRTWLGWYHHMAMISMASLFCMNQKKKNPDTITKLSVTDISEIITFALCKNDVGIDDVVQAINFRHKQRTLDVKKIGIKT